MKDIKLISAFDGIGCFPKAYANVLGLPHEELSYESYEIADYLIEILEKNLPNANQNGNILNVYQHDDSEVAVMTMGTPCPGYSIAGKGEGRNHEETAMFDAGLTALDINKPKYFIWENVFGVVGANKGQEFRYILNEFSKRGYDLAWSLLDSKYFNLPQRRRRVYVIGARDGLPRDNNIFHWQQRIDNTFITETKKEFDHFRWDFSDDEGYKCFYNIQRSDRYKEDGIAATIRKRDYKDFTDIVQIGDVLRKISLQERLALQGMPTDWFDGINASNQNLYKANGMSLPVVEYVFEELIKIENGIKNDSAPSGEPTLADLFGQPTDIYAHENVKIHTGSIFDYTDTKNVANSGMYFKDTDEFILFNKISESSDKPVKASIDNYIDFGNVSEKLSISQRGIDGLLRRVEKGGNVLPSKMMEAINNNKVDNG